MPTTEPVEDEQERILRSAYQHAMVEHSHTMKKMEAARDTGSQTAFVAAFRRANDAYQQSRAARSALDMYSASKHPEDVRVAR